MGETSRRQVAACSPRSHRRIRATFRGHEQPGPAPARMWPAAAKCPARLDIAAPRPPRDGDDPATHPEAGLPLAHGPRAKASRVRAHAWASPPQAPALGSAQATRPAPTRFKPAGCRPGWPPAGGHPGTNHALTSPARQSRMAPPGRPGPYSAAAILKQVRNTMSGRSGSVVYGVTVGKRQRNPLMGNMKRSRRTLKWPAGFS
jgi:hypothetical protein